MTEEQRVYFKKIMNVIAKARDSLATPSGDGIEIWYQDMSNAKNMDDVIFSVEVYTPEEHNLTALQHILAKDILNVEVVDARTLKFGKDLTITGELLDASSLFEHVISNSSPAMSL